MYYEQRLTQAQIAQRVGLTRSMISRILTEAERRKIIEIRVNKPRLRDTQLEGALTQLFRLKAAQVILVPQGEGPDRIRRRVGAAGAHLLQEYLSPNAVLGIGWGTSESAVVDELHATEPLSLKVIQLVAALGSRNLDYDGPSLVQRLVTRLGGEGFFLHAPFMVDSPDILRELIENPSMRETVDLFRQCEICLTGLGSTDPRFSSYYRAGYVPISVLEHMRVKGAVGDVCGHHFDINGNQAAQDFDNRVIAIRREDFLAIPTRIGIASGPGKPEAIVGALRGEYINALVTDALTATRVVALATKAQ